MRSRTANGGADAAPIKLNIGCGTDYRPGFINIDGSGTLSRVDAIIDLGRASLTEHFGVETVDHVLANDILEHFYHWEAVALLKDFYQVLKPGGTCEIRVPDCEWILGRWRYSSEEKLTLLFGGQDVPQGRSAEMDRSRKENPSYFCHRYGWTRKRMRRELRALGFSSVKTRRAHTNFLTYATKKDRA
jgi:predicted SAM-dependent methyltransferase